MLVARGLRSGCPTCGSGRLATRAFAVPSEPQRFRRPTDVVLLVLSLVILAVTASVVDDPGDLERSFADWLSNLPGFLDFLWKIAYDLVQIWVLVVGVLALARRRWGLLRDWAISIAVTIGGVLLVGWLVDGEVPALSDSIGDRRRGGRIPVPRARGRRCCRRRRESVLRQPAAHVRSMADRDGVVRRRSSSASRNPVRACVHWQSDGPLVHSSTSCSVRPTAR